MRSIQNWSSGCGPSIGCAGQGFQLGRAAGVVEVAVGDPDLLHRQPLLGDRGQQPRNLAARIDHRGLLRLLAPDDGAILLQRRHRRDEGLDRGIAHEGS